MVEAGKDVGRAGHDFDAIGNKSAGHAQRGGKIRGAVIMEPLRVPKVLTATAAEMAMMPAGPISRLATSAATSSACFICWIGIRYR